MATRRGKKPVPRGFEVLHDLQPLKPATMPKIEVTSDADVLTVKNELERICGGAEALIVSIGQVLRRSLDRSYDGGVTGRFHLAQLSKTEKAHTGSLFEIELQSSLDLADGHETDYQVAGFDVDAKYTHSHSRSPSWMIGPEIEGNIALLAAADDYFSRWSAWLVWVTTARRNVGSNRDAKASLNDAGRQARIPIAVDHPLPPNQLLQNPEGAYSVMRVQGAGKGQERIRRLCREFEGILLSRTTICTVAMQLDPAKRMRENGGARSSLAHEGFIILGNEARYRPVARSLGLPQPARGEFLPLRVAPAAPGDPEPTFADLKGSRWRRARTGEVPNGVPTLAHHDESSSG